MMTWYFLTRHMVALGQIASIQESRCKAKHMARRAREIKESVMDRDSVAVNQNELPCDRNFIYFHGYRIYREGRVLSKRGVEIKPRERKRQGRDKTDLTVNLYYNGSSHKWTLHRLVASCFLGPIHGYEINHKNRNTHDCHVNNLERVTASENSTHWRLVSEGK